MLERGAELKEKCSQRAFLSHGTSGVFLHHARLHWGALLAPGAVLKCKFAVVDLFCRLTRPCVDRYHVSTTSKGKPTLAPNSLATWKFLEAALCC